MSKVFCIALATAAIGMQCRGALLAGTPASAPGAGSVAVGEWGLGEDFPIHQARPFSTGATSCYLNAIDFNSSFSWESGNGGLSVSLYNDNAGLPGAIVAGGQDLFSATSANIDQLLNAESTLTLAAHSTYWFVASIDQSQGATRCWWDLTDSALFDSDVIGTDLPLMRANDAAGWAAYSGASMQMSVYGTVVPEPGTVSLLSLAGLGSFLLRRGRFKRSRSVLTDTFTPAAYDLPFLSGERAGRRFHSARHREYRAMLWIPLEFESEECR